MCIIVCKNKGQELPDETILKRCFTYNSDGAGIAYNLDNKVYINKGFLTYEELKLALDKLKERVNIKDVGLILHFRIGTAGTNGATNTHPYPLTGKWWLYKKLDMTTKVAVAHNGVIRNYEPNKTNKHDFNDTQLYIMKRLAKLPQHFYKNSKWLETIGTETGSRFAFLDSDGNIYRAGTGWVEDNGFWYSNTTYKPRNYGYNSIYNYYDEYYNDYYKTCYDNLDKKSTDEDIYDNDSYTFDTYTQLGEYLDELTPVLPDSDIFLNEDMTDSIYAFSDDNYFVDTSIKALYKVNLMALEIEFISYYVDIVENW